MKFLLFSDLHYYPGVFMGGTWEDLKLLQKRAEEENCDFIIHAGDFCHGPSQASDYTKAYNDFHIPSYHVMGNHDTDNTPYEETLKLYHMPDGHYFFDRDGYRMIAADTNYYCVDGEYVHFSMSNYFKFGPYRDHMPPEQLKWLEETIDSSPYPCIIFNHSSFEREPDGVKNQKAVREIINRANKKRPRSVLMCINGHFHRDHIRILDQVCYMEINSASFEWVSNAHDHFPAELKEQYNLIDHTVIYNDPLFAIVTVEGNQITIQGTESSMFMGIGREDTPNPPFDKCGRPVMPRVQSARICLD